jgi:hypothetical protein
MGSLGRRDKGRGVRDEAQGTRQEGRGKRDKGRACQPEVGHKCFLMGILIDGVK